MTITTERVTENELRQIIASHENGTAMAVRAGYEYLIARELLAAREAVPVYQMRILDGSQEQYTWAEVTREEFNTPLKNPDEWEKRVLYTALPAPAPAPDCEDCGDNPRAPCGTCQRLYAPAVPDESVNRDNFEKWVADYTGHTKGFVSQFRSGDRYQVGSMWNKYWDTWNACRAAMLGNCATNEARSVAGLAAESGTNCADAIPPGYKLAPNEPTESMVIDGFESDAFLSLADAVNEAKGWPYSCAEAAECVTGIFKAMLARVPAAPEVSQ